MFLLGLVGAYSMICSVDVGVDYCKVVVLCFWQSTVTDVMDTSGHSSPIWAYRANAHKMRSSHDQDRSNPKDMCSLGVVDLDLTRMLPKSSRCELRLMLPDSKLGTGFHNVLIDNLAASPSWRSSHISPADVTVLRQW